MHTDGTAKRGGIPRFCGWKKPRLWLRKITRKRVSFITKYVLNLLELEYKIVTLIVIIVAITRYRRKLSRCGGDFESSMAADLRIDTNCLVIGTVGRTVAKIMVSGWCCGEVRAVAYRMTTWLFTLWRLRYMLTRTVHQSRFVTGRSGKCCHASARGLQF